MKEKWVQEKKAPNVVCYRKITHFLPTPHYYNCTSYHNKKILKYSFSLYRATNAATTTAIIVMAAIVCTL